MTVDRLSFSGVVAILAALFIFTPADAQVQTKEQRRCLVEMNKGFGRVAAEQGKVHKACIKLALNEKLDTGLQECFLSDPKGKVAEAQADTIARESTYCGGANTPDFGTSDAATINVAAVSVITRLD